MNPTSMKRMIRRVQILSRAAEMEPDGTITPARRNHARELGYSGPLRRDEL